MLSLLSHILNVADCMHDYMPSRYAPCTSSSVVYFTFLHCFDAIDSATGRAFSL